MVLGAASGWSAPAAAPWLEALLWPVLAALLYVTFVQVPLVGLAEVLRDNRFLRALFALNFGLLPALVWLLARGLPCEPALLLGVYLVLLVPCTDWFVSFTLLGGGDARRAIAATPVLLLAQMVLLPCYLWLFLGREFTGLVRTAAFLEAFLGLIGLPLVLAAATEWGARRSTPLARWLQITAWLPVPLLGLTVYLIAAAQARIVLASWDLLGRAALVFGVYAATVPFLARGVGRWWALEPRSQRTLVFSAGTRNSFVVLPFALALPAEWRLAVAVIVLQSLIELGAMIAYLWCVPRHLIPAERTSGGRDHPPPNDRGEIAK